MNAVDVLAPERIGVGVGASSKKRALELCSGLLAAEGSDLESRTVFEALWGRERLACTGIGRGVALPHARMPGLRHVQGAFLLSSEPVPYDAADGMPVDLFFALLVPDAATDEHLNLLASLARLFSVASLRSELRKQTEPAGILELFVAEAGDS